MSQKAYIILAHKNFKQVGRLISALQDGQSQFFLHVDARVPQAEYAFLQKIEPDVSFIEPIAATWGSIGAAMATIHGMRAVQSSGKPFDQVILLSGQDYPIKSTDKINEFFERSPFSVFIDSFHVPCPDRWVNGGMFRINKYYCGETLLRQLKAKFMNLPGRIYKPWMRHMPARLSHLEPYGGSQWFSVDLPAMNYILNFVDANPDYVHFMRHTYIVDEVFFCTILRNAPASMQSTISGDNLRFINWAHKFSKHPRFFGKADIERIQASAGLFARKFDETFDGDILDLIDQRCLNLTPQSLH